MSSSVAKVKTCETRRVGCERDELTFLGLAAAVALPERVFPSLGMLELSTRDKEQGEKSQQEGFWNGKRRALFGFCGGGSVLKVVIEDERPWDS